MSDETQGKETGQQRSRPDWVKEAEEALERATAAIRTAWHETREPRMSALDSAKQAAKQLGEAIDRGVETARTRWQTAEGGADRQKEPADTGEEE